VIKRRPTDPTDAKLLMHCFRCYMNNRLYREASVQAQAHLQAMYYDTRSARPSFDALHWVTLDQAKELDKVPKSRGVESSMYIYEVGGPTPGASLFLSLVHALSPVYWWVWWYGPYWE
jgi:hypothetical protein